MVRPRRQRRIAFQPDILYFKPAGVPVVDLEEIVLAFEEIEVIRLIDEEEQDQQSVAQQMNISQPTLSRLLKSARKKIATALTQGKAIKIEGGEYELVHPKEDLGHRQGRGFGRGQGRGFGR
jgi:predicted DNA-binding protein (UPF0251 family)